MKFRWMLLTIFAASFFASPAAAQYVDQKDPMRFESESKKTEWSVSGHFRFITLPDFILGAIYDEHSSSWSDGPNLAYGGGFIFRKKDNYELAFIVDYADLRMEQGLWRESGDDNIETYWTDFDLQILSFVIASYFIWDVNEWFSPYVGGGIGPGFTLGAITKYQVNQTGTCYTQGQYAPDGCVTDGEADLAGGFQEAEEEDIPFVIPVLNAAGGARFTIEKHASVKLELGFNNYFYAGINLGGQW